MTQPVLRASEVGLFTYCERAWGYAARGETSGNESRMLEGSSRHRMHAAVVSLFRRLRALGILFLFVGMAVVAVQLFFGTGS